MSQMSRNKETNRKTILTKEQIGLFIVIFCGMAWGLGGVMGQLLFKNSDITPALLSSIRMTASGIILLTVSIIRKGTKTFSVYKSLKDTLYFLYFALAGIMAVQFTYFASVGASNAATATVIQYIYPVLILLTTAVMQKRKPKFYETLGVISAFTGVFAIATHFNFEQLNLTPIALFWGILSAVSYAIFTIAPVRLYKKYGLIEIVGNGMLVGGLVLFFVSGSYATQAHFTPFAIKVIIYITIFSSLLPMVLYGKGVSILGSVKASLFVTVEPIFCALISIILGMTKLTIIDFIGFLLILVPIEYMAFRDSKK